jgi:hypothetical protein
MLVRYNYNQQIFEITTVDVTIQQKGLKGKVDGALEMLKKLLRKVPMYNKI